MGHLDVRSPVDLLPALVDSEDPGEGDRFEEGEGDQGEGAGPVIVLPESPHLIEEEAGGREHEQDAAKGQGGALAAEVELVLEKGHHRLAHGQGTGDAREEEEAEPGDTSRSGEEGPPVLEKGWHGAEAHLKADVGLDPGEAEVGDRDRDDDRATEDDLDEFVHPAGRGGVEGDVVLLAQVGGIALDGSHPDREGEKDLSCCRQPDLGIGKGVELRLPEKVEPIEGVIDRPGLPGIEGEGADSQKGAEDEQQGHTDFTGDFHPFGEAARENVDVDRDRDQKKKDGGAGYIEKMAAANVEIGAEKVRNLLRALSGKGAGEGVPDIAQGPGFDIGIVGSHCEVGEDAEDPDVLPRPAPADAFHHPRG
ncbi:MAG: hypothetical protein BWY77_00535 [bacterium ADurb.Bin431]|nr:MAG: hypothetical protein BWY77_00535 [bacterium ADurb.Bin431]